MKYYELSDGDHNGNSLPEVQFCHEYKAPGDPLSGVAILPPQCLDAASVEVARVLRLTPNSVGSGGSAGVIFSAETLLFVCRTPLQLGSTCTCYTPSEIYRRGSLVRFNASSTSGDTGHMWGSSARHAAVRWTRVPGTYI